MANDEGTLDYFSVVECVEDLLDQLAEDGKIQRSYYPDSDVERYVKYLMKYITSQEYPEVSADQAVYALTQGPLRVDSYNVGVGLDVILESETEGYDRNGDGEWRDYSKQGFKDQFQRYGLEASPQEVSDLYDGFDTNEDGVVSDDEIWEWVDEK